MYPMTVYCDNLAAQACAKSNGDNKLRHMVEGEKPLCQRMWKSQFYTSNLGNSKEQFADIFTKALEKNLHKKLTYNILNMKDM